MFLSLSSLIIMSVGTVIGIVFIILVLAGKKYDAYIEPLTDNEYPLNQLYGVGFLILDITKHNFASKAERKRRQQIALIYGEKHAEYYLRVNAAERITLAFALMVVGFALYGITVDLLILYISTAIPPNLDLLR